MKKLFAKSAVAVAVGLLAGNAIAASDLTFTGGIGGANGTVVLAHEIFGEGNPGVGSAETLVQMKSVTFDLEAGAAGGDLVVNGDAATVKFTLGQASVFGEDLSSTLNAFNANGGASVFFGTTLAAGGFVREGGAAPAAGTEYFEWKVEQGGAIGDNTITIRITARLNGGNAANLLIQEVGFRNAKIKNLQSALKPSSSSKKIEFGVEYVEGTANVDAIDSTATDVPVVIFGSKQGVGLDFTARTYVTAHAPGHEGLRRINVGADEKFFTTDNGRGAAADFGDAAINQNLLGTLNLFIETYSCTDFPQGVDCASAPKVRKENGDAFDFQGGDAHKLTFSGNLSAYDGTNGKVYLDPAGDNVCSAPAASILGLNGTMAAASGGKAVLNLTGNTTALTQSYDVCVQANGVDVIPEEPAVSATWTIDYFNARYDNDELTATFGPILRNGCIASFFNIPAGDNASDTAFIRMTNTSAERDDIDYDGKLYAKLYAQDGTVLASGKEIDPDLNVHETAVFTSASADVGTAKSLPVLLGANVPAGTRGRLVITGAFPTCEALGLVRNSSTGILTNMTSTTQAQNQDAQYGNNGN